ncbi:hypothetical protein R3P38DRAFT_3566902 [Favolaschia claudopus]|uniref:Uncharacterized protein n=1 Tax=Favolaschia claudopus TaxID=2862362 RepID=A0AAW0AT99_9AGAR
MVPSVRLNWIPDSTNVRQPLKSLCMKRLETNFEISSSKSDLITADLTVCAPKDDAEYDNDSSTEPVRMEVIDGSLPELEVSFSISWVRITRGKRGRALQLYQNITYDDIDLTGDEHTPPYLSLLAHTSVEDLIPFMQSHFPPLLTYPSLGSSPALSPGDRVVVVAGRFVRQSGFILQFMETISEGQTTLYAKVIPSDRGFYNPNQSGRAIYPKLSNLRRHALDFAYEFRCRDRVMFDRKLWHIESVDERSWTLSLSDSQASISGIPFDQVCRVWQTGDLISSVFLSSLAYKSHFSSKGIDRGTKFHGVRVQVVGLGVHKGLTGVIIGDHDSEPRKARLERARMKGAVAWRRCALAHHGILLTIRKDASNVQIQDIPIEDVIHESTSTPLLEARHLPHDILKSSTVNTLGTTYRGAFPVEEARRRSVTPPPLDVADISAPISVTLSGENDGSWMDIPNLAFKRVDVHIHNISAHMKTLTKKALNAEGKFGHLLLTDSSMNSSVLTVHGVGPTHAKITVPKICIRPRRASDDALPLTMVVERVVIIGPDIEGVNDRLGLYAETLGECGHGLAADVVGVRFGKSSGFFFYHSAHLCLAKNVFIQSTEGVYHTTDFEDS